ncbi:GNAT family N-acetyltransferase [Aliidiomarina indica]|uniref:GNAT family N-acetyltransferase n=1 Tax=Aliidiomarina indica TaxID=2749147 RepID=UPI00189020DB|nr:GNAT family N-acetyltransferase [Aliidiomarina indica]
MLNFTISTFNELSNELVHNIFRLRQDIFIVEQNCVYPDIDGIDPDWLHLCAFDEQGLVAYARVQCTNQEPSHIGRVVVHQRGRGKSYGRLLMQRAITEVIERAPDYPIELNAQSYLLEFYTSLGFHVLGDEYLEDGIPHRHMEYHP